MVNAFRDALVTMENAPDWITEELKNKANELVSEATLRAQFAKEGVNFNGLSAIVKRLLINQQIMMENLRMLFITMMGKMGVLINQKIIPML